MGTMGGVDIVAETCCTPSGDLAGAMRAMAGDVRGGRVSLLRDRVQRGGYIRRHRPSAAGEFPAPGSAGEK